MRQVENTVLYVGLSYRDFRLENSPILECYRELGAAVDRVMRLNKIFEIVSDLRVLYRKVKICRSNQCNLDVNLAPIIPLYVLGILNSSTLLPFPL